MGKYCTTVGFKIAHKWFPVFIILELGHYVVYNTAGNIKKYKSLTSDRRFNFY